MAAKGNTKFSVKQVINKVILPENRKRKASDVGACSGRYQKVSVAIVSGLERVSGARNSSGRAIGGVMPCTTSKAATGWVYKNSGLLYLKPQRHSP